MKVLLACLLSFVLSANTFDADNFVKKFCTEKKNLLICKNFNLTKTEQKEIQDTEFIISNATIVELHGAGVGIFNENFVNKFPNTVELFLIYCNTSHFNHPVSSISRSNLKLERLVFIGSRFYLNAESEAFSKLTALKTIEINHPHYMQHSHIGDILFSKNINLETVDIRGALIDSISSKAFIKLKKLKTLKIIATNISTLNKTLIRNNTLLEEVNFNSNNINHIPFGFFPNSVEQISFRHNNLQAITKKTCWYEKVESSLAVL